MHGGRVGSGSGLPRLGCDPVGVGGFGISKGARAVAEQGGADANEGGALFDGDLEVPAHAHAEDWEWRAENLFPFAGEFAAATEDGTRRFGNGGVGRHAHESVDLEASQGVEGGKFGEKLGRVVAELRRFTRDVDLNQDPQGARGGFRAAVKFLGETQAVDALDHLERLDRVAGFVGLEVADEMPAEVRGALGDLRARLLDAVLAEERDTKVGDRPDRFRRVVLAHGHEFHGRGIASGAIAGVADAALDLFEVRGKVHGRRLATRSSLRNREHREHREPRTWRRIIGW